ncbi:D-hexose-6-phosphate mutarotase [Magnetospirillum sp. UT-4]|uniref:D-hexose-6-phosphate mutarotase n=1 Tax=Magnetospirillum sp. UT-4 TaxID=2681467 RepID=UPI001384E84B|nr:D-hexose-6-phosphate mutarotase [Magnetospirillum sp. UT-4]CAA7625280.1 Aldose 1-epimerase [Magnetospirillum sp. UT-4]
MDIQDLAQRFGITDRIRFVAGKGGLILAELDAAGGSAVVSTYAGQVLSFRPDGAEDLMFLSDTAYYAPGKAIKGGVPVCWPWFGPDPEGKGRPGHGFVRNRQWEVRGTEALADGRLRLILGLSDSDDTRTIWPHAFDLRIEITVGAALEMVLATRNLGPSPFALSQGLHTYFRVGDIARTRVLGLEDCAYIDKMDGGAEKRQQGAVTITGETDRIYTGVAGPLEIDDAALARRIRIVPAGSASAVVWNPWDATARSMADLGDDDYLRLICVETTNAADDTVTVAPGAEHRLSATYTLA